jgi:hypothetical protein
MGGGGGGHGGGGGRNSGVSLGHSVSQSQMTAVSRGGLPLRPSQAASEHKRAMVSSIAQMRYDDELQRRESELNEEKRRHSEIRTQGDQAWFSDYQRQRTNGRQVGNYLLQQIDQKARMLKAERLSDISASATQHNPYVPEVTSTDEGKTEQTMMAKNEAGGLQKQFKAMLDQQVEAKKSKSDRSKRLQVEWEKMKNEETQKEFIQDMYLENVIKNAVKAELTESWGLAVNGRNYKHQKGLDEGFEKIK